MSQTSPLTAVDRVGISGLSNDQRQTLVNILDERKSHTTNHQSESEFPFGTAAPSSSISSSSSPQTVDIADSDFLSPHDSIDDTVTIHPVLPQVSSTPIATQPAAQTETASVFPTLIPAAQDSAIVTTPAENDSETLTATTEKEIETQKETATEKDIGTDPHKSSSNTSKADDITSSSTSHDEETEPENSGLVIGRKHHRYGSRTTSLL
ncbi:unnamed protein product [Arabidopsis halleri]